MELWTLGKIHCFLTPVVDSVIPSLQCSSTNEADDKTMGIGTRRLNPSYTVT